MRLVLHMIIFLLVFGPKFGFLDISLLSSSLIILTLGFKKSLNYKLILHPLLIILSLIIVYLSINSFRIDEEILYPIFRLVRAGFSCFSIYLITIKFQEADFEKILINLIVINSLFVILQVIFPDLQALYGSISGFDKGGVPLRGFGFTSGYDTSGIISLIGLSLISGKKNFSKSDRLFFGIIFISLFFISRLTLSIGVLILIYLTYKKKAAIIFLITCIIFSNVLFELLDPVISVLNEINFRNSYNPQSGSILSKMFFFPETSFELMFGTGRDVLDSDVGYIKIIFMYGVVGLLMAFIFYINILRQTYLNYNNKKSIIFICAIFLIFNIKGLFLFSRSIHEILFLFYIYVNIKNYETQSSRNLQHL